MIYLYTFLGLVIIILIYLRFRDISSPAFIYSIVWELIYFFTILLGHKGMMKSEFIICPLLAFVLFDTGFCIPSILCTSQADTTFEEINLKPHVQAVFIITCNIIAFINVSAYFSYWNQGLSIYRAVRIAQRDYEVFSNFSTIPVETILFVMFILYIYNPDRENKKGFLLTLPSLVMLLMATGSKGGYVYIFCTYLFIYIYVKKVKTGKLLTLVGVGIISALSFFAWTAYDFAVTTGIYSSDLIMKIITDSFRTYFILPFEGFIDWADSYPKKKIFKYVFRFFFSILNRLDPTIPVMDTIQPYYYIDGLYGNVYTSLYWSMADGGLFCLAIFNFFYGLSIGFLYLKIKYRSTCSIFSCILLSMLIYTVIISYFSEQVLSIASIWIQRIIYLKLFTLPYLYDSQVYNISLEDLQ